jgi:hypothetical protein
VLKLRCNKRSAYIETPTPPSSKRSPHFETRTCLGENKNFGHGSWGDWSQEWLCWSESESYVTTDCQSASQSRNKAPIWGSRCQTVAGLLMWGALSDERTALSFTVAADPRQRSRFRVRVPWESWLYFTVSDSTLPFSSPSTTRRVTVEVLDPASTRDDCPGEDQQEI